MVDQGMSLNGALRTCEVSKQRWYWRKKTRVPRTDTDLLEMILYIRKRRPFYGTRRVAAELARRLGRPVNRKRIRRACCLAGWSKQAPFKADAKAVGSRTRRPGPTRSGRPTSRTCGVGRPMDGAIASTYWMSSPGVGLPTGSTPWPPQMSPWTRWWGPSYKLRSNFSPCLISVFLLVLLKVITHEI